MNAMTKVTPKQQNRKVVDISIGTLHTYLEQIQARTSRNGYPTRMLAFRSSCIGLEGSGRLALLSLP